MIGKTILHYKILEKLGEGGMGVVYLAEDTKLERKVAIKFLPTHIAGNSDERKRFELEAKAAAALNHNNISHIYAIEDTKEQLFIVMEYIDGNDLKNLAEQEATLSNEKIIDIAKQIAEGLAAAHEKGIVHRDIKSTNIMMTKRGKIKIMDFGLAKFRGSAQLTKAGTTIGTAAYMSPEQARSEDLDQRSDIWSFGVILYELLTGRIPFKGDYEAAIMFSILNDEPENLLEIYTGILENFAHIVNKCLEKQKENRYQSIDQIIEDLNKIDHTSNQVSSLNITQENNVAKTNQKKKPALIWLISLAGIVLLSITIVLLLPLIKAEEPTLKKMLVVMPFENLGDDKQDYFADGITGEITSKLSGLSKLGVIARSSAMQYKNTQKSLQQIGEELGVQYVLEGTVQWEERANGVKRVRVNPELIKIENATQIWSKPYEADFSSAFKLQADIAATVADALNLTLIKSEKKNLEEKITNNSEAYDIYLRALTYSNDIDNEKNSRIAEQMLLKAIELDGNFAAAYARLSTVQSDMYWQYFERTEENLNKSETNAQQAVAIDPNLPAARVAMGDYLYHGRLEYEAALQEYRKALSLQPNNVEASNGIGFVLRRQGKMREAITFFEKTFELDPMNFTTAFSIGETLILLREYEKAIPFLDKAISIMPDGRTPYLDKSHCALLDKGDIKKARNIILQAKEQNIGLDYKPYKYQLYLYDIFESDFNSALKQVQGIKELDEQFSYKPEDLLIAFVYGLMSNKSLSEKHYKKAIQVLEQKIKENPDDSRLYTSLGLAYAGLGRKPEALREGKKGFDLLPISREAWRGTHRLNDLAKIYAMLDEQELALDAIEELLEKPTDALSVWLLKLDPTWNSLHGNPRYQKLIENMK